MRESLTTIDEVLSEINSCKSVLSNNRAERVSSSEEKSLVKATVFAWLNTHRETILHYVDQEDLIKIDSIYNDLLIATDRSIQRTRYVDLLKDVKEAVISIRSDIVLGRSHSSAQVGTTDNIPNLSPLVVDPTTQDAITRRWKECIRCIQADAPLAAIVMMGGLIEGLLLARVNREKIKTHIFTATLSPKDSQSGNPLSLKNWTLKNYLDVAHEVGWISHSAKDVGVVLRDYRNYIHPYKEISHGVSMGIDDARVIWEVVKSLTIQIVASV